MEEIRIYITLKEAEELIFNHYISVEKVRLNIKSAQRNMSVFILVIKGNLIEYEDKYMILSSIVNYFDIPKKDEILFLNHYNIPAGLLNITDRKVKDEALSNENLISFNASEFDAKTFKSLRNGLFGIYHYGYALTPIKLFQSKSEKILNEFNSLSSLRTKLLYELFKEFKFPMLRVQIDRFVTDGFFRVVWWGKFVVSDYLPQLNLTEERNVEIKSWLKVFLNYDDVESLNHRLSSVPDELGEEIDFLLGYYFSTIHLESYLADENFLEEFYASIKYKNKEEVFVWVSFFTSVFNQKMSNLFFVRTLNDQLYNIERLAFELSRNNFDLIENDSINIKFKKVEIKALISEYLDLKVGSKNSKPQIIKAKDAKSVFENNLFENKWHTIGSEISQYNDSPIIKNTCTFSKGIFVLKLEGKTNPKDVTFYLDKNSLSVEKLKQLKFKMKPIDSLLEKKKKVLLGFINTEINPKLPYVYAENFRDRIINDFDKVVFVILVDLDPEKLHSIDFDNFLKDKENGLKHFFGNNIEVIVKNERSKNNFEIKRNLKNALKEYKTKQIEVIDENFDETKAGWLIESGTEYFIENDNLGFYSFFNN